MNKKELEDYLWGAANILRGMIDAADFKQYIFPLLFFKRISDLWDEEYKQALDESGGDLEYAYFAENHRFQIPDGCHWEDVRKKLSMLDHHFRSLSMKLSESTLRCSMMCSVMLNGLTNGG